MRRHKHLFEEVVSFDNLLGAARDALRGRRLRQPGASFYASLEEQVVDLQSELSSETYQPGGGFRGHSTLLTLGFGFVNSSLLVD